MSRIGGMILMQDAGGPWIVNVDGRAYGPYDVEQMRDFAGQGRLVAMSQVARAGKTEFRNAMDDPELAPFFVRPRPAPAAEPARLREPARPATFGKERDGNEQASTGLSHLIIIADMKSRSINGIEEEIAKLGTFCPLLPQVWMLSTEASVNAVRNALIQQLGKLDMLMVIDASRDKAAWFNFGPEMDARIRRIWTKQTETKPRS